MSSEKSMALPISLIVWNTLVVRSAYLKILSSLLLYSSNTPGVGGGVIGGGVRWLVAPLS